MSAGNGKGGRSWDDRYLLTYLRAYFVADSTYNQYEQALNKWHGWGSRRDISVWLADCPLAVQVQHIFEFVLHGFRFGYGSGGPIRSETIISILHGIRHLFATAGYEFPITHPHIRILLKGISHLDAPPTSKSPAFMELLETCFRGLTSIMGGSVPVILLRSQIVAISNGKFRWFAVRAEDIVVVDRVGQPNSVPSQAQSVCMRLIGSKTN
ncbi:Hypothetical protein PHPALM_6939 [Phytophthora palmivora]|uniref:Uncharacterized protein n=1 Tax=Phytophthora palmivora TaxID=4796 RepID=A0A2P4YDK1_9STRA|nr:Hypothetical protein PHPALM_6939 [Phytophthora palmivora]